MKVHFDSSSMSVKQYVYWKLQTSEVEESTRTSSIFLPTQLCETV